MSVFVLSAEDFGSITASLKTARTALRELIFPLSDHERLYRQLTEPDTPDEDYARSLVEPFVFRLYAANQMAEQYTYLKPGHKNLVVPMIDFPQVSPGPLRDFLRLLGSLSYNIVTNGGNTFLGIRDQEKLDQIISRVQRELVGE